MDYRKIAEQLMIDSFGKEPPFTPPEDMSKGEVGILTYLTFFRNSVLAGELASSLRLSTGRIAIALKSLEKKRFLVRSRDVNDARKVVVTATDEGKKHAEAQKEKALSDITKILESLGEEDAKLFVRLVYKVFGVEK